MGSRDASDVGFRRTWDKEEYKLKAVQRKAGQLRRQEEDERKAKATENLRLQQQQQANPTDDADSVFVPSLVSARETDLGLGRSVGKTVIVQTADGSQPGFHCDVCDRTYKDNMAYLDHINGLFHLKALGIMGRTVRSTVEQVRARLLFHKTARKTTPATVEELRAQRERRSRADEVARLERKERKRQARKDRRAHEDEDDGDDDAANMAKVMGFKGFSSTK